MKRVGFQKSSIFIVLVCFFIASIAYGEENKYDKTRGFKMGAMTLVPAKVVENTPKVSKVDIAKRETISIALEASLVCQEKNGDSYKNIEDCQGVKLEEGDRVKIHFSTDQDAYLYVLLFNDKGQLQMPFPQKDVDNKVTAGVHYTLPPEDWWEMDNVTDTKDVVKVIASPYMVKELEDVRGMDVPSQDLLEIAKQETRGFALKKEVITLQQGKEEVKTTPIEKKGDDVTSLKFELLR